MHRLSGFMQAATRIHIMDDRMRMLPWHHGPSWAWMRTERETEVLTWGNAGPDFDCWHLGLPTFTLTMAVEDVYYSSQLYRHSVKNRLTPLTMS